MAAFDPFRYDWQAPFRSARQPAPQRLTLEELLAQSQKFQPSPRPAEIQDLGGLNAADRRRLQLQSVFSGMGALGAAMSTGDWRYAGQGAGDVAAMQEQAVAQANARQEQAWQEEQGRRAAEYQQQERQTQQAAIYGMYQRAVEGEAPDSPFVARAEAAARAGNMSELATMASPEVKSKRRTAQAKGYDPDVWDTSEKLTTDLAAELEQRKRAALEAQELERQRKEAEIAQEAKLAQEEEMRKRGLGSYAPPQLPPLSRIEAEEAIRAKFRAQGSGAATRRIMEANGVPGLAEIDASGQLTFKPAVGIPEKKGAITYMTFQNEDMTKTPYRLDEKTGEWYPMKVNQTGAPPREPAATAPAPAAAAPPTQALHLRNLVADALSRGGTEAEALQRLRAAGPKNGYTPEQILEQAKAMLRRRKG